MVTARTKRDEIVEMIGKKMILVLVTDVAKGSERNDMVNIKFATKFLLADAAVTAFVAIALARSLRLSAPVRAVILESSTPPVVMIRTRSQRGSKRNALICFGAQSLVPRGLAEHGGPCSSWHRGKVAFVTAMLAATAGIHIERRFAPFARPFLLFLLSLTRTLAAAILAVLGNVVDHESLIALRASSLAVLCAGFALAFHAAMLGLFGCFASEDDTAVFTGKCLGHAPILPRLQEVGACQNCKVGLA